jgi:hypothetical protein
VAELSCDGDELVVILNTMEKLEAAHGDVRVPMSAVQRAQAVDDVVHAVPGLKIIGAWWPGKFAIGTFYGGPEAEKTFAVVHHGQDRGVKVALSGAKYDEIVVSCENPETVLAGLGLPG